MSLPIDVENALCRIIADRGADSACLAIYPKGCMLGEKLAGMTSQTRTIGTSSNVQDLNLLAERRWDLAIVINALSVLTPANTRILLARLRHADARAVLAVFACPPPAGVAWQRRDFLALGFRQAAAARSLTSDYWLYRYDIHDYKLTPDWLGPRHWANPGRWDKDRW